MNAPTRSDVVDRIVHGLAKLPGSEIVDVTAINFSRVLPAEVHSTYQKTTNRFATQNIPDVVTIPPEAEEVIIRLQGKLHKPHAKDELVEQARNFFSDDTYGGQWDLRAHFQEPAPDQHLYELTIFQSH